MDNSKPKDAFLFMKVGPHGCESLDQILNRKEIELNEAGMIFWGYGGTVLHPQNQVQPFVDQRVGELGRIEVLMQRIEGNSKVGSHAGTAKLYAANDNEPWKCIPEGIKTGSKHALVLEEIRECELKLDLRDYKVGIGPSEGENAANYLKGRTDKGALVKAKSTRNRPRESKYVSIEYRAHLLCPYAVFLCPPW